MQTSFADLVIGIVRCYHGTARYQSADILQSPAARQQQYGADKSALVRISYFGVSGERYQMDVGILGKAQSIRTTIQFDSARIPYNKKCELERWVAP